MPALETPTIGKSSRGDKRIVHDTQSCRHQGQAEFTYMLRLERMALPSLSGLTVRSSAIPMTHRVLCLFYCRFCRIIFLSDRLIIEWSINDCLSSAVSSLAIASMFMCNIVFRIDQIWFTGFFLLLLFCSQGSEDRQSSCESRLSGLEECIATRSTWSQVTLL